MFEVEGEAARPSDLRLITANVGLDGPIIARLRQFVHGHPVKDTYLDLVISGGVLFSVRSRLEAPSRLSRASAPVDDAALTQRVAALTSVDGQPRLRAREFDAQAGRWIAIVETEREVLDLDEQSGVILDRRSAVHPAAVTRLVRTVNFGTGWDTDDMTPTLQQRNAVVNGFFFAGSPNTCEARMDRWAATSVGEPRMVPNFTSNSSVFQTYTTPFSCSSNLPTLLFDHPILFPAPPDLRGIQASAYFWNHDLAFFARSFEARLHAAYPFTDALGLYVNANDTTSPSWPCQAGVAGCYTHFQGTARINLATNSHAVYSLGTMAHEYGHYISAAYGYSEFSGLSEGIAMALQLRYGRYRAAKASSRPHDSTYTSQYSKFSFPAGYFTNRDHRGSQRLSRGQWLPDFYNEDTTLIDLTSPEEKDRLRERFVYSETAPHPCADPNTAANIHDCGSIVAAAYWTLVHNQTRVNYFYIPAGTPLTTPASPFTSSDLADLAFTYALQLITPSSTIVDFFDAVEERYINFRTSGVIDSFQQLLVQIALGAHCLGSIGETCRTMHRLPDSPLPSAYTTKVNYREAESGVRGGNASITVSVGNVAADQYVFMVGPTASVCWSVSAGIGGFYEVHIAGLMTGASTTKFDMYTPATGWIPVQATAKPGWAWHTVQTFLNTGSQQLCIRTPPNAPTQQYLYLDAVALELDL